MLAVLSDTHGRDDPRLEGRTEAALEAADVVIHAGDYVTADVLEGFEARCELRGVYGNNDSPTVRDRVPAERVVEWEGLRIAVVHGHEHTETALAMFGRQSNADLLVFGHSHDPEFVGGVPAGTFDGVPAGTFDGVSAGTFDGVSAGTFDGPVPMLNPGSHADPRWNRPGHAELEWDDDAGVARGRLVEPAGEVFERFTVARRTLEE